MPLSARLRWTGGLSLVGVAADEFNGTLGAQRCRRHERRGGVKNAKVAIYVEANAPTVEASSELSISSMSEISATVTKGEAQ